MNVSLEDLVFKIPQEQEDYLICSQFVVNSIEIILEKAIQNGRNKIIIDTNLKLGLPMENINKIAGPFVEAWAFQTFYEALENIENPYSLINVEACGRLDLADIILHFKRKNKTSSTTTAQVDSKATSQDIQNSGKSPNITSFAKIRTAYVEDPDLIFIILSLKHKVHSEKDAQSEMMKGIMEVVHFNAYDFKYLSEMDISYNPALGTGQIQVRDIHYVSIEQRSTWEFCQLLDKKCIASKKGYQEWLLLAQKYGWLKNETI
jgi:hypothetical protein